jgi:NADPH2:quinone reductase
VRARGTLVFFGMAGGDPKPVDPRVLMDASKRLVGADLWSYLDSREARLERAARLFDALRQGTIGLPTIETMPLSHGSDAHRRLEDRSFAGKIVMIPD